MDLSFVIQSENTLRERQKCFALGRHNHSLRRAPKETATENVLQPPKLLADRGLRPLQCLGSTAHAAGSYRGREAAQRTHIQVLGHKSTLWSYVWDYQFFRPITIGRFPPFAAEGARMLRYRFARGVIGSRAASPGEILRTMATDNPMRP